MAEPSTPEDRTTLATDRAAMEALLVFREIAWEFGGPDAKTARPKIKSDECERRQQARTKNLDALHAAMLAGLARGLRPWGPGVTKAMGTALPLLKECADCVETHRATCGKAAPSLDQATKDLEAAGVVPKGRFENL